MFFYVVYHQNRMHVEETMKVFLLDIFRLNLLVQLPPITSVFIFMLHLLTSYPKFG